MSKRVVPDLGKPTKKTGSEYGLEFEAVGIDQTTLNWTDENVAIVTAMMKYVSEGELYKEFSVQGSTALNNSFVNYYIWDSLPGLTMPEEYARILINNSKLLVRINK